MNEQFSAIRYDGCTWQFPQSVVKDLRLRDGQTVDGPTFARLVEKELWMKKLATARQSVEERNDE